MFEIFSDKFPRKGTVRVISSDPPCKDGIYPVYNGILQSFV